MRRSCRQLLWKPVVKCGQQSLEVFSVGIYLSFIGYFVLETTSNGIVVRLLIGAADISVMTAVAYYRSWSKRIEKLAHDAIPVSFLPKTLRHPPAN